MFEKKWTPIPRTEFQGELTAGKLKQKYLLAKQLQSLKNTKRLTMQLIKRHSQVNKAYLERTFVPDSRAYTLNKLAHQLTTCRNFEFWVQKKCSAVEKGKLRMQ